MSHRAGDSPTSSGAASPADPRTLQDERDHNDDLAALAGMSDDLKRVARQVDEAQQRAIDDAVERAVTASDRRARSVGRRTYWLSLAGAFLLSLAISLPFALIGYFNGQDASREAAELRAGDVASSDVTSARASSLEVSRRDLARINAAMAAAGLTGCADPGAAANAQQVSGTAASCLGELRTIGELEKRGVPVPGVRAPDPEGPGFPAAGFTPAG